MRLSTYTLVSLMQFNALTMSYLIFVLQYLRSLSNDIFALIDYLRLQ